MVENKGKSRVEIFLPKENNWIISSYHNNDYHAIINADVIKSRKDVYQARVIDDGKIIYITDPKEEIFLK